MQFTTLFTFALASWAGTALGVPTSSSEVALHHNKCRATDHLFYVTYTVDIDNAGRGCRSVVKNVDKAFCQKASFNLYDCTQVTCRQYTDGSVRVNLNIHGANNKKAAQLNKVLKKTFPAVGKFTCPAY
ncbi:hypothetical protein K470DRAFT_267505 [Piedraia hortae CBS 480.64]|uniref:Uncharacterized protein n=1 Tax=Piedraia hortae CBS 480.64 TaxID=1314780 RepID=A0A6A7CAA6_9PEZI|nr:hypothetical protein K470DRAFT_267505 [Piedraia hortae CBS 480.64]